MKEVINGEMRLNDAGQMVQTVWDELPKFYIGVDVDAFIVMPNHVHGIVVIQNVGAIHELPLQRDDQNTRIQRRRMLIPKIIGYFKMKSAKRINILRNTPELPVWQRNYYERVIRDEDELLGIQEYIAGNPDKWVEDENNPVNLREG